MSKASLIVSAAALLASCAAALDSVTVQGQNFVVGNNRFEIVGVDYQPGGEAAYNPALGFDPLSNGTACLRDAALMQLLGINTIRTYNVDPDLNHDDCASIFNEAGIYMMIDVNSPLGGESVDTNNAAGTYTYSYLNRTFAVMDAFRGYPNLIGFFSANELVNNDGGGNAITDPPYIRAVTRDLKQYLAARGGRSIPVGYANADNVDILVDMINYIQCELTNSTESRSDFFGLNDYQWCGPTNDFHSSGYDLLTQQFADITIPPFFSEYGCNKGEVDGHRDFPEVPTLYGPQMTVFSGGLIYEWTQETNNYGLVQLNANSSVTLLPDFTSLQNAYLQINLTLIDSRNNTAVSITPPECSADLISNPSQFSNNFDLPAQPSGVADLIKNGVGGQTGKLVTVSATAVPFTVYNYTGEQLQNVHLTPTSDQNTPTSGNGGGTGTTSGSGSAETSHGAAPLNTVQMGASIGFLGLVMLFLA